MSYVLGIDLGTSYSAAAIGRDDGTVEIVQLGERAASIPSLVLLRADGEVLVGEAAERRSLTEPTRTAREFKRRLGDPVPLVLGGTPYGADALVAILLRAIVAQVVAQLDEAPRQVVITHPASYGPYKLDVLAGSLRQAGLDGATLIAEPVAAAIQYASQERVPDGAAIAVYDFGGGTFDASVLRKTATGFALLGDPEGLDRLGGIDFDEAILRHVIAVAGASAIPGDPGLAATAAVARLREECRRAKEALSSDTDATIPILLGERRTEVRLTRSEFEAMIEPRIGETIDVLERAVRSAELRFEDLHRIVLVGGTSRIPRIAEIVHHRTGRPVGADTHPKHAVALGAARSGRSERRTDVGGASPNRAGGVAQAVGVAEPAAAAPAGGAPAAPAAANGRPGRSLLRRPALVPRTRATRARAAVGVAVALALTGGVLLALAGGPLAGAGARATPPPAAGNAPTLPPAPTPLPVRTASPGIAARITSVQLAGERYLVSFMVTGFTPSVEGRHVHFFWSSVPEREAGAPGHGPWMIYGDASPFTGISPSSRPDGATGICILVANADHTVIPGSGNCVAAP